MLTKGKSSGFYFFFFSRWRQCFQGVLIWKGFSFHPDSCGPISSWLCTVSGVMCAQGGHWLMLEGLMNMGFSPTAPSDVSVRAGTTGAQDE